MTERRYRGAHAAPTRSRVGRRVLDAAGVLVLIAGIAAAGAYLARDTGSAGAGTAAPRHASPTEGIGASRPSAPPPPVGSDPGETAPDFAIPTADGGTFRLSSYRGRIVVMDFLAPGCIDCTAEISTLTKTWEAFKDEGVVVIVVDVGGISPAQAAEYYRGLGGGDFLYGEDRGFRVALAYEVIALSSTFVIDPRGVVSFRDSGFVSRDPRDRDQEVVGVIFSAPSGPRAHGGSCGRIALSTTIL